MSEPARMRARALQGAPTRKKPLREGCLVIRGLRNPAPGAGRHPRLGGGGVQRGWLRGGRENLSGRSGRGPRAGGSGRSVPVTPGEEVRPGGLGTSGKGLREARRAVGCAGRAAQESWVA